MNAVEIEGLAWRYPAYAGGAPTSLLGPAKERPAGARGTCGGIFDAPAAAGPRSGAEGVPGQGGPAGGENPWALDGVDLQLRAGECFGLTGPSGAGKTTLCKAILGIVPHTLRIPFMEINQHLRGAVRVLGETVTEVDPYANPDAAGRPRGIARGTGVMAPRVGMLSQDAEHQFLHMSLLHEVAFGLQILGLPEDEIEARVRQALEGVGLGDLWSEADWIHPADLSGGQKQRVAIAAFLAMRPQLLILDEPTSDLDPSGKHEVIAAVRALRDRHDLTVLLVEQDPEMLAEFCDRVALLDRGRVVFAAAPTTFYSRLDLLEERGVHALDATRIAAGLGVAPGQSLPLTVAQAAEAIPPGFSNRPIPVDTPGLDRVATPRRGVATAPQDEAPRAPAAAGAEPVAEAKDLCFQYPDGTWALRGAHLTLQRGDFVALLGPNGSGKTTLAKILAGIIPPWRGTARVLGRDLSRRSARKQLPRCVGYVFQNPDHQLFTRRVADEVAYGPRNLGLEGEALERRVRRALEIVDLLHLQGEDPLFLGKGQRQRLAVASVLAMAPEFLIVDEPTTGQDYRMLRSMLGLMQELHRQGTTVLIITHDMRLVAESCAQAAVLVQGRTIFHGATRELFADPQLLERARLRPPQAIRLSWALRARDPNFPLLLSVEEWAEAAAVRGEASRRQDP